jgi:hypothetical protein
VYVLYRNKAAEGDIAKETTKNNKATNNFSLFLRLGLGNAYIIYHTGIASPIAHLTQSYSSTL